MKNLKALQAIERDTQSILSGWLESFPNDHEGMIRFCFAIAMGIAFTRDLFPVLQGKGIGQDFIDMAVKAIEDLVESKKEDTA